MGETLFEMPEDAPEPKPEVPRAPRVLRPQRQQVLLRPISLERLLPDDHPARAIWVYVEALDLSAIYAKIKAVEGRRGRCAIDPKILMALWLLATVEGIGSARALDRLCSEHIAFQWICGGVGVNYHALSDFRTKHAKELDKLLTDSVAVLRHEGLVTIDRVAQDGMRVRANAGAASFRRKESLERCLQEAEEQVERLRRELDEDPGASDKRQKAARERATTDRVKRVQEALRELDEVRASKKTDKDKDKARASTTDPEARVMKMPDGGFRPAFNVQFCADTETQVIVGVDVTNVGTDSGQLVPMVEQVTERHGVVPSEVLVDGGFASLEQIDRVTKPPHNCTVFAPVQRPRDPSRDRYEPRATDRPAVADWRRRMATDAAKETYKQRAATAECVNALARNRGLRQFLVRGLRKAKAVALWFALAHNLMRTLALRAQAQAVALAAAA